MGLVLIIILAVALIILLISTYKEKNQIKHVTPMEKPEVSTDYEPESAPAPKETDLEYEYTPALEEADLEYEYAQLKDRALEEMKHQYAHIQTLEELERKERAWEYLQLKNDALAELGFKNWDIISYFDAHVVVKSRQTLEKYDDIKFFKEDNTRLEQAKTILKKKSDVAVALNTFLEDTQLKSRPQFPRLVEEIEKIKKNADAYRIRVDYQSSAGRIIATREIELRQNDINKFHDDPSLLMNKGEYNQYIKEKVIEKQHEYYEDVNKIIDYANEKRDSLIIKGSQDELDSLIDELYAKTVHHIDKIKTLDSGEWGIIGNLISRLKEKIEKLVSDNQRILDYYESSDFLKIKETCEALMSSQRDFNEYIKEKADSIAKLFGTRVIRNETVYDDEYHYIRPYKKTITPFTAHLSSAMYGSAENNPLKYVVKCFYPNKDSYPEQIQKLYRLVEELETLKDAKQIIENYKAEYQQYLSDVPDFIIENDEAGFYSRLGFATIDESVLAVEYKFSYTSDGGMKQRSFTFPMTEEHIAELIKVLESKLTASAFAKEQRTLMTKKLREFIKKRDNYTCCQCGNSTHVEPNLLLEIDHIKPVSKGGLTTEENLQTLCWKCNRTKSDKLIN